MTNTSTCTPEVYGNNGTDNFKPSKRGGFFLRLFSKDKSDRTESKLFLRDRVDKRASSVCPANGVETKNSAAAKDLAGSGAPEVQVQRQKGSGNVSKLGAERRQIDLTDRVRSPTRGMGAGVPSV